LRIRKASGPLTRDARPASNLTRPMPTEIDPPHPSMALHAAIVDDRSLNMDRFLAEVVREQQALGLGVRGLLMRRPPRQAGCSPTMVLVDIATGDEYLVSQPMGTASRSCRADPQGFARASHVLRAALDQAPDLVVSNRFGDLEVQRGGFGTELLELMAQGLPLLTTVAERNVDAWQQFTGGSTLLAPDHAQVSHWIAQAVAAARATAAAAAVPQ
jgi:nucleoside-triphosphatase THEP1